MDESHMDSDIGVAFSLEAKHTQHCSKSLLSYNPHCSSFFWEGRGCNSRSGFFAEKLPTNPEQIDLTLKLSPCGQIHNAEEKMLTRSSSSMVGEKAKNTVVANGVQEGLFVPCVDRSCSLLIEGEKGLVRFGDLQTMRRVRTGKRLLLEKLRRAAAEAEAEADKSLAVSTHTPPHSVHKFNTLHGDSLHEGDFASKRLINSSVFAYTEGGTTSNVHTSTKQENDFMCSAKTMREMPLWPFESKLESPGKKLKHAYPYSTSDAMEIMREMPSVTTTGDGPTGKRIEGVLYKYNKGQVCIICVCHGSFLSPAEFVMHAGGNKEVADPMKHITVSSDSSCINGDGVGFITHPF
ncbi:hypothetical protein VNO77_24473 [Canavalia gladiata]|uniref:Ninja-family protein n=1 Tax=Canavalia gladiata TaxID=3824 RepID=A0AAN9L9N1_CANGL